jgi:hypothetical protein
MAGKGDKPRPINKKVYDKNYKIINWSNTKNDSKNIIQRKNKITFFYK